MNRQRALEAVALLAPLCVVLTLRTVTGPAGAHASISSPQTETEPLDIPPPPRIELTPDQRRAREWSGSLGSPPSSPMYHRSRAADPVIERHPAPAPAAAPPLRLSVVLERGRSRLAVINGEIFAVGQTVADGWILESIDVRRRAATLLDPTGRRVEITADR